MGDIWYFISLISSNRITLVVTLELESCLNLHQLRHSRGLNSVHCTVCTVCTVTKHREIFQYFKWTEGYWIIRQGFSDDENLQWYFRWVRAEGKGSSVRGNNCGWRVVEINDLSNIDWMYWQFLGEGGLGQSLWLLAQTFYTWVIHNWLAGDLIVWSLPWGPRRVLLILFRVLVESLLTSSLEFMCLQDINKKEREVINI